MAELGLLANLAAVIGVGLQTSIALYSLANTIGSAGRELEDTASDISLFCRVLKQVQKSLNNPVSARLSATALQDTQDVVERCNAIIEDIKSSLESMTGRKSASIDLVGRVKWTFKRPKILLQRSKLQSCTVYLHLMLSILDRASRSLTSRQTSKQLDSQEEELDIQMRHSLMLTQQCANRRLEEAEDEVAGNSVSGDIIDSGLNHGLALLAREPLLPDTTNKYRVKRKSVGISNVATEKALPHLGSADEKRTSVLINERVFEDQQDSRTSKRTPTYRINTHQAVVCSDVLLQRWTYGAQPEPTAPAHGNQTLLSNPQSEPDRASYISWDSEPASLSMPDDIAGQAKDILRYATTEQQIHKEEARRAWEELGRREQEERERMINLRNGVRTIVGGIEVVPVRSAEDLITNSTDRDTKILSPDEITRVVGSDLHPDDKSMWVWDNTREEILKVNDQTRGDLHPHDHAFSTMRAQENSQRQFNSRLLQASSGTQIKTPKMPQTISPTTRTEMFPEKRSTYDRTAHLERRPASNIPGPMDFQMSDSSARVAVANTPAGKDAGKFTSISQRGVNPGWRPSGPADTASQVPPDVMPKPTQVQVQQQTHIKAFKTQNLQGSGSHFAHAFERWETLSSHWEGLTSFWIRRLQENSEQLKHQPFAEQMTRQITDLSAAGANLFHAVVELQRLRASSERKFQRWFFETKEEHERAREVQGELERLLRVEREGKADASARTAVVQAAEMTEAEDLAEERKKSQLRLESGESRESSLQGGPLWQPREAKTRHARLRNQIQPASLPGVAGLAVPTEPVELTT